MPSSHLTKNILSDNWMQFWLFFICRSEINLSFQNDTKNLSAKCLTLCGSEKSQRQNEISARSIQYHSKINVTIVSKFPAYPMPKGYYQPNMLISLLLHRHLVQESSKWPYSDSELVLYLLLLALIYIYQSHWHAMDLSLRDKISVENRRDFDTRIMKLVINNYLNYIKLASKSRWFSSQTGKATGTSGVQISNSGSWIFSLIDRNPWLHFGHLLVKISPFTTKNIRI